MDLAWLRDDDDNDNDDVEKRSGEDDDDDAPAKTTEEEAGGTMKTAPTPVAPADDWRRSALDARRKAIACVLGGGWSTFGIFDWIYWICDNNIMLDE